MGYALLFSGQGHQNPSMLPWLRQGEELAAVEREIGVDWRTRLADPAASGVNAWAQKLLTGTSIVAYRQLRHAVGPPDVVAGYSVGELAAFSAADVFDLPTALHLAGRRADCMDRAVEPGSTGLVGAKGRRADIEAWATRFGLAEAIRMSPETSVLGGPRSALDSAARAADALGIGLTPLNIAAASHTHWMSAAVQAFAADLARTPMRAPGPVLFASAGGRIRSATAARTALAEQLARTIRWDDAMEEVRSRGIRVVLEIGAGRALANAWMAAHPDVPARSADEFRSIDALVRWIGRHDSA